MAGETPGGEYGPDTAEPYPEDDEARWADDDGEPHGEADPDGDARIGLIAMEHGWGEEASE